MVIRYLYLMLAAVILTACQSSVKEVKVLQFNIWQEGTSVEDGYEGILDNIESLKPDLITFSEVRNYNGVSFIPRLVKDLETRGLKYFGEESVSTGIISKYEILSQEVVYPLKNDRGSVIRAIVKVGDSEVALYSAHLDWQNCSYYFPRGYDGTTWKRLDAPILDADSILMDNKNSFRDDEVKAIVDDAKKQLLKERFVIIGGDFNEPSHLDWQSDTNDIRDHRGVVADWDCSKMLEHAGFKDAFRVIYPDPVKYPGFTFPANNPRSDISKLAWSPEADDRERIDFIYYYPNNKLQLKDITIVGPEGSILYGQRTEHDSDSQDSFILPKGIWPTDHKALLATFRF